VRPIYRLLFIEDSAEDYLLMKRVIDNAGFTYSDTRVMTTDALRHELKSKSWDVFILDHEVPGAHISDYLKILRGFDEMIPIIVVSGTIGEDQVATALQYGARDYVMKDNLRRLPNVILREVDSYYERSKFRQAQIEKEQIKDALISSEKKFKNLVENSSDIFLLISLDGKINYISPTVKQILGYEQHEVLNRTFFDFVHPDHRKESIQNFYNTVNDVGLSTLNRHRIRHADGSYRYLETRANNQLQDSGINALIVNARDDTKRIEDEVLIEQHIKAQEILYQSAFEYLKMDANDNMFKHICNTLHDLVPNSVVVANEYDEQTGKLFVHSICGLNRYDSFFPDLARRYTVGKSFKPNEKALQILKSGVMSVVEGGLHELFFEELPKPVSKFVQQKMNIRSIRTMGIVSGDNLHGNVVILEIGDEVKFPDQIVETFIGVATVALQKKLSDKRIADSLHEKEVMLKEIHHRVKNNLQIISSLLELQAFQIKDDAIRYLFLDSQSRVKSMALVHEKIYQSEDLSSINYKEYIDQLAEYLFATHQQPNVTYSIESDYVNMPIDSAIPAGIIINELITNCLKHAFPNSRKGSVGIKLKNQEYGVLLVVEDDGIGMNGGFDLSQTTTLGLELVNALSHQLNASVKVETNGGTRFSFEIPLTQPTLLS
jgi:PAS domain S-box-containing protein